MYENWYLKLSSYEEELISSESSEDNFIKQIIYNNPDTYLLSLIKDPALHYMLPKTHNLLIKKINKEGEVAPDWLLKVIDDYMCVYANPPLWALKWTFSQAENGKFRDQKWSNCSKVVLALTSVIKEGNPSLYSFDLIKKYLYYLLGGDKSNSFDIPDWVMECINNVIIKELPGGEVSTFSPSLNQRVENWIYNILNSGNAPEKWIKYLEKANSVNIMPSWARIWAINSLIDDSFPKTWKKKLIENILNSNPSEMNNHWASDWLEKELLSKKADKKIYEWIISNLKKDFSVNKWSSSWILMELEKDNPPEWANDVVSMVALRIKNDATLPSFIEKWVENKFKSDNVYSEWIAALNYLIHQNVSGGRIMPNYARIISSLMISKKCPSIWYEMADILINKKAIPAYWADSWARHVIKDGYIPQKWMPAIEKYIKENQTTGLNNWCFEALQKMTLNGSITETILQNDSDNFMIEGMRYSGTILYYSRKYPSLRKNLNFISERLLEIMGKPINSEILDRWSHLKWDESWDKWKTKELNF